MLESIVLFFLVQKSSERIYIEWVYRGVNLYVGDSAQKSWIEHPKS